VLIAFFGILLALLVAAAWLLWRTLPPGLMETTIPGLSAQVKIDFDPYGIPRIRAATARDGAAALGFVHARDRMFQMDLMRRAASGRLSEIAGPVTLPMDRQMRVLGLRRGAEADVATLDTPTRDMLAAYAAGVNAWIAARGRFSALEFLLLGAPEFWTEADSLLWGKTMGMWLSENWRTELSRLSLAGKISPERIDELWPPDGPHSRPDATLPTPPQHAEAASSLLAALPRFPQNYTQPSSASNEWAVDGRHSATGAPLLAGDPHLAFNFPGIWYLARIETPERTLTGATAPGVPFLVMGQNGHIAWTFTTNGADVQDIFVETPIGKDTYQTPDGPRPFTVREERIRIRGQPDEPITIRETRHGPVISDLLAGDGPMGDGPVLAVAMANLQPADQSASGLLGLNQAKTLDEAAPNAARITAAVQNLLIADKTRIGLFVTGRVPIRRNGDGSAPVPGADGTHDWIGWATGEELPRYVDPPSGRLTNANEPVAPPDFPAFLGRDWQDSWRGRHIRTLLDATDTHTVEGFARMQMDVTSEFARQILPTLLALPATTGLPGQAAALLAGWDGTMAMNQPQPLIFNAWLQHFRNLVLSRAGIPPRAIGPSTKFVAFLLSPAGAHWCGGNCTKLLTDARESSMQDLAARFGADPAAWRWGAAHHTIFAHPLLRGIPLLGRLATIRIETAGDTSTLGQTGTPWDGFDSVHGAGYRGVYDLANPDRSLFIAAPGQSGNLFSRHARDLLTRWRDGHGLTLGPRAPDAPVAIRLTP
jgi:penicillin amidase